MWNSNISWTCIESYVIFLGKKYLRVILQDLYYRYAVLFLSIYFHYTLMRN